MDSILSQFNQTPITSCNETLQSCPFFSIADRLITHQCAPHDDLVVQPPLAFHSRTCSKQLFLRAGKDHPQQCTNLIFTASTVIAVTLHIQSKLPQVSSTAWAWAWVLAPRLQQTSSQTGVRYSPQLGCPSHPTCKRMWSTVFTLLCRNSRP